MVRSRLFRPSARAAVPSIPADDTGTSDRVRTRFSTSRDASPISARLTRFRPRLSPRSS